jgi:twinkle protein
MRCGIDEDDYNKQTEFVNQLAEFATSHNVHVHLVAHPRKKSDDKNAVGVMDIKGSSTISNLAFNVLIVWKNKEKRDELSAARTEERIPDHKIISRPDAVLICDKQREGEWEDQIGLWFDQDSMQFVEREGQKPVCYLADDSEETEWWQQ